MLAAVVFGYWHRWVLSLVPPGTFFDFHSLEHHTHPGAQKWEIFDGGWLCRGFLDAKGQITSIKLGAGSFLEAPQVTFEALGERRLIYLQWQTRALTSHYITRPARTLVAPVF